MPSVVAQAQVNFEADAATVTALLTTLSTTSVARLYLNSFSPNYSNTEADFVAAEATFTGYAAKTIATWSAVVYDIAGNPLAIGVNVTFICSTTGATNSLGGVWLETMAGALIRYFPFPNPISISAAGQFVSADVFLYASQLGYANVGN